MNSYQLKQTARSRRNNAQKVQRPLLNFKASKDKAKDRRKSSSNDQNQEDIYRGDDAGDNEVISDHASGDDNDDMDDTSSDSQGSNRSSFDYRSDESDDEHCSFESKLKLVDFDIHDEMKDKFLKFTDSYDAWMNQHEYDDQKLSDRHPFTVQQFSEEFSAILAKQIVQKGTDSEILSLLKRFVPDVNWPVRIGKNNSCFSNMDTFKEPELPFLKFHICPLFCTAFVGTFEQLTSCPYCDSPRFTNRSDQIDSGTPLATISYRPLLFYFMSC